MIKRFAAILGILMIFSGIAVSANTDDSGIISTTGQAYIEVSPDIASLSVTIITEDKDISKAIKLNNEKAQKVYDSLRNLLKEEDKIKTSNYKTTPVYTYNKSARKSVLTGYRVSNSITIKTGQIDEVGTFIDTALNNGANNIENLNFSVKGRGAYCRTILADAAKNAKLKAETLASALGVKIKGIKRVTSSCDRPIIRPVYRGMALEAQSAKTPIEAGEITINAEVNIDFEIE